MYLLQNKEDEVVKPLFDLAFNKRPEEELYDLSKDPDQINNVAAKAEYQDIKKQMATKMIKYHTETKDPRIVGGEIKWENAAYYAEMDKTPRPSQRSSDALGLEEEYNYDEG